MEDIDAEELIALVRKHPIIWHKSQDGYRERVRVRDAWMIICAQLREDFDSLTVPEKREFLTTAVKRWRNIRDQWLKWRNKHRKPLEYTSTSKAFRRRYVYHDQLKFLEEAMEDYEHTEMSQEEFFDHLTQHDSGMDQPELLLCIKSSASTESLNSEVTGQGTEEPEIEHDFFTGHGYLPDPEDPLSKKRKRSLEVEDQSEENRHMMFFRSIIPYFKAFSERQILDFQMGVLQLVKTSMDLDPLSGDQ